MRPLNQKRLRRILAENPSANWFDVREVRLTEKKKPKLQNRFKALYVCARYWSKTLNCEARAVIVEPSNGETFPKAVLQLRPRQEKQRFETVKELERELKNLIIEVDFYLIMLNVINLECIRKYFIFIEFELIMK